MGDHLDPRGLIFPVTNPPPTNWADVQLVCNRVSRHWGLIRGLIVSEKRREKGRAVPKTAVDYIIYLCERHCIPSLGCRL